LGTGGFACGFPGSHAGNPAPRQRSDPGTPGRGRKAGLRRGRTGPGRLSGGPGRPGGNPPLAPRRHQFSPSPPATGAGDSGHPGAQRHRRRTGIDPVPAAQRPCGALHPGGGHGGHPIRPGNLERAHRQPGRSESGPHGGHEQDRRPVGRAQEYGGN